MIQDEYYISQIKSNQLSFDEEYISYHNHNLNLESYNSSVIASIPKITCKYKITDELKWFLNSCFGRYYIDDIQWTITFEDNRDYVEYELTT
jgi:uncharacterized protein YneR